MKTMIKPITPEMTRAEAMESLIAQSDANYRQLCLLPASCFVSDAQRLFCIAETHRALLKLHRLWHDSLQEVR